MESMISEITKKHSSGKKYLSILAMIERQMTPHETLKKFWDIYDRTNGSNNLNGKMFEFIVCECLVHFGVGPLYFQSRFYGLEHDTYDLASWTEDGSPIIISCKTSLRERWKQAELEGRLLKLKYPKAESYLITLNDREANRRRQGIRDGTVTGIDEIYLADQPEFDSFVERMKRTGLTAVKPILPLQGTAFGIG